jgi:hypothetical protein
MLIQDWGGIIRVFPAMPTTWKDASFHNLRTEGAFLVSAVRKGGKTQFIRIKSLEGEPCKIKSDFTDEVKLIGPESATIRRIDGLIEVNLKKGEEAVLFTGKMPGSFVISALPSKREAINSWGVRKN